MSARPNHHRDAAVMATMQARFRVDNAVKIYGARVAKDANARVAMTLLDILDPMLRAIEGLLHEPLDLSAAPTEEP